MEFNILIVIFSVVSIGGLLALYGIIEAAVRNGINNSIIGLEKKNRTEEDKKSFIDDGLDNKS